MSKTLRILLIVAAALNAPSADAATSPAAPSVERDRQLAKLAGLFRRYRTSAKRRADMVKQICAAGPRGIAMAKELIEKELGRLAEETAGRSPSTALDEQIERLRKVLAELRADAALTKEKIQKVGVPALSRLTVLCGQRQLLWLRHRTKFARTHQQVEQLVELLRILQDTWKDSAAPLPVKDYLQQAGGLTARIVDRRYEEAQRIMTENAEMARRFDPKAVAGMRGLNQLRVICGLKPLVFDLKLCQAATGHSADMRSHKFFAHESPLSGKRTMQDRARQAGTTASGENIYMGSVSAASAGKAWFLSPGHHKNMLGQQHRRQGLGNSGTYWTHLLGR